MMEGPCTEGEAKSFFLIFFFMGGGEKKKEAHFQSFIIPRIRVKRIPIQVIFPESGENKNFLIRFIVLCFIYIRKKSHPRRVGNMWVLIHDHHGCPHSHDDAE